jgi:hypothetical protein
MGTTGFSLPRQHAIKHYPEHITSFGAPNGLCSSITENKHIKAVKKPYRRSNRFKALGQMIRTNQRLDKLAAARRDFQRRRMLDGTCLSDMLRALEVSRAQADNKVGNRGSATPPDAEEDNQGGASAQPDIEASTGTHADEDDDGGPVDEPGVLSHVCLAKKRGEYSLIFIFLF